MSEALNERALLAKIDRDLAESAKLRDGIDGMRRSWRLRPLPADCWEWRRSLPS
jgi:hypothetical protein